MIADQPQYDTDEKETKKNTEMDFQEQTSEDLLGLFQKHLNDG